MRLPIATEPSMEYTYPKNSHRDPTRSVTREGEYYGKESVVQGKSVFENWDVIISNRGIEKIHYRIPEGKEADDLRLYIKSNKGAWEERDFSVEGSYMVFDFTAADSGFALANKVVVNPIVVIGVVVAVLAISAIYMKKKGIKLKLKK